MSTGLLHAARGRGPGSARFVDGDGDGGGVGQVGRGGEPRASTRWQLRPLLASLLLCASSACIEQTIDLRQGGAANDGELQEGCGPSERIDPATGACAACVVSPDPEQACPCAFRYHAAPFPFCAGEQATYDCLACFGSIRSCRGYDAEQGKVTDCGLLLACCDQLLLDPDATPCCPSWAKAECEPGSTAGESLLRCVDRTCCLGTACGSGGAECESWQSCDPERGVCVPACNPTTEICCADCGCQCRLRENPP